MSSNTKPERAWIEIGPVNHMEDEDVEAITLDNQEYAVYCCNGRYFVTDNRCTHMGARLCEGIVLGEIIECPLHQGRFHIPTGATRGGPVCKDLKTYPAKLVDGLLYVALEN